MYSWMLRLSARSSPSRRWVCSSAQGSRGHWLGIPTPLGPARTWHPPAAPFQLLSAEILHCRGLVERLLGFSDPLLRCCPEPLRQRLQVSWEGVGGTLPAPRDGCALCPRPSGDSLSPQPSVQALRERTEQLSLRSGACAVQLEHAQSLLTQFSEALEELLPWLEETQALGVQLSPNAISYEAFKEQQALLQVRAGQGPKGLARPPRGLGVER